MHFFRLLGFTIQFMTRIPIKKEFKVTEKDFGAMTMFFPVSAAIVGAIMAAVYWLFSLAGLQWAGAVGCVLAACVATGGLHVDGFADMADAFGAGKHRKKTLEILKDSHMGTYGVLAIVFIVLIKVVLIGSIPNAQALLIIAATPVAGKIPLAITAARGSYPREEGTGKHTIDHVKPWHSAVCCAVCAVLLYLCAGSLTFILLALAVLAATGFTVTAISNKKIQGVTGDILGAANELGEMLWLLLAALWCALI
jgi:adenosylcobinamide-GDP ribazoletransferase